MSALGHILRSAGSCAAVQHDVRNMHKEDTLQGKPSPEWGWIRGMRGGNMDMDIDKSLELGVTYKQANLPLHHVGCWQGGEHRRPQ